MKIKEFSLTFYFYRRVLVTYVSPDILLEGLQEEMRAICQFSLDQEFTMKWIDEEGFVHYLIFLYIYVIKFLIVYLCLGDPCTISSQVEIDEAIRLYEVNNDSEITIHSKFFLQQPTFYSLNHLLNLFICT